MEAGLKGRGPFCGLGLIAGGTFLLPWLLIGAGGGGEVGVSFVASGCEVSALNVIILDVLLLLILREKLLDKDVAMGGEVGGSSTEETEGSDEVGERPLVTGESCLVGLVSVLNSSFGVSTERAAAAVPSLEDVEEVKEELESLRCL